MIMETLRAIHTDRVKKGKLEAEIEERQAQLRASPLQAEIDERRAQLKEIDTDLEQLRADITEEALAYYRNYGNKQPFPGVGIRVSREVTFEPTVAREWCWANLPSALMLDAKIFSSMMLQLEKSNAAAVPGFVKITDRPSVTIATDLSQHLPPAPDI